MKINPYALPIQVPGQGPRVSLPYDGLPKTDLSVPVRGKSQGPVDEFRNRPRVEDAEWVDVYDSNALLRGKKGAKGEYPVPETEEEKETLHAYKVVQDSDPAIKKYTQIANPADITPGTILSIFA